MTDLLTLTEAAEVAGVNPASLRQAIARRTLSAEKHGRDWFVARAEIERYIAARQTWKRKRELVEA